MDLNDNLIYLEDGAFEDFKNDMEEFLIKINEEPLQEFKSQLFEMFTNVQTHFNNASNMHKLLNETKDKLKKNIKSISEITKNIEDDNEKFNSLKNDYDNLSNKLENAKSEETDKEKEIKKLNEEITRLRKVLNDDMIEHENTQENDQKKKLTEEEEQLIKKIEIYEDRKRNIEHKLNETIIKKLKSEEESKEIDDKHQGMYKELADLDMNLENEKKIEHEIDLRLDKMKSQNQSLKETFEKIKTDKSNVEMEIEELIKKKEERLSSCKLDMENAIASLEKKKIPELKKKISESDKKIKEQYDTINALRDGIKYKEEQIAKYEKDIKVFEKTYETQKDKINQIKSENDKINNQAHEMRLEIVQLEKEIDLKKHNFYEESDKLSKKTQENNKLKKDLEKLMNEMNEVEGQIKSLQNINHHYINEHYGIKRESQALEMDRENIEKDKNLYAKHASDANMEHTQALEKLKNLTEAIDELKAKNNTAEAKLKQQRKIYEALKADCARFAKKYQDTQIENKELTEEKEKKEHKLGNLKIEFTYKQGIKEATTKSLEEHNSNLKIDETLKNNLQIDIKNIKESVVKLRENNNNLKKMIASAEIDHQAQKKEYQIVVNERDFLGQQLIKRNEEILSLYEKIKTLQLELTKLHSQYKKKLIEIEKLKSTRNFLIEEFVKAESIIRNIFELKVIKIKLEKELLIVKNKVSSLSIESKKNMNIHRWTKLEYSDPEKFELISQINSLQKRLIAKTEEVNKKEELIQEKEKLYVKLKGIVARQNGSDMEEALVKYQKKIKEETDRLKKLKEEIKYHRNSIRNYEFEIKRIDSELGKLKNEWFEIMKKNLYDTAQPIREYEEEDSSEDNPIHNLIDNNEEYLEYYNKLNSA